MEFVLVRHGETEWSANGRHTSRTDLPLVEAGRERARTSPVALRGPLWALVLSSPLRRARETCELAGLGERMTIDESLREWDYGDYEGLTTPADPRASGRTGICGATGAPAARCPGRWPRARTACWQRLERAEGDASRSPTVTSCG